MNGRERASEAAGPVVSARGIVRRFGALVAVDGVDLDVHKGEVFGFLGPNGSGKSTLLRILLGLLRPSAGSARVLGCEIPREAERLRPSVGYMTQRFSLYDDLSVRENLEFAGQIFGLERDRLRAAVDHGLGDSGLGSYEHRRASELSGGWKQKLALAAASVHGPELLVLDEPTAGVDPQSRREFWAGIFHLSSEGTTVLVSTHYMDEAVRCHRLCLLRDGRRAALGRPRELIRTLGERVLDVSDVPIDGALDALAESPLVASTTQLGETAHVLLEPRAPTAADAAPLIAAHLRELGFRDASVRASAANLEDVFVSLVLGEEPERAPEAGAQA